MALVAAGIALIAVPGEATALGVLAMVLLGGGLILAVSLAFFAVGRSEDRARAQEEASERAGRFTTPRTPKGGTPPRRPPATRRRDHE